MTLWPRVWLPAWLALLLAGGAALVRWDIAERRAAFHDGARVAHQLLSRRAAQHDAILATLALLPAASASSSASATAAVAPDDLAQRLPQLYPQLLAVLRRAPGHAWDDPALAAAEAGARRQRGGPAAESAQAAQVPQSAQAPQASPVPQLANVDAATARYTLLLPAAAGDGAVALRLDARRLLAPAEWPLRDGGPLRAALVLGPSELTLDPGPPAAARPAGLTAGFTFSQALASASQPFELRLQQDTGPAQWPWGLLLAWAVASGAGLASALQAWRTRQERRRAAELARLAQAARLGSLGGLAAGLAHELNQPLTAMLAGTRTALRLLPAGQAPEEEDLDTARQALELAAAQARRAADVLARLRRLVERPSAAAALQPVRLEATAAALLALLGPELQRRGVRADVDGQAPAVWADPVALEQIVLNLLTNALQALEAAPPAAPAAARIALQAEADAAAGRARLVVRDNGPGIAPQALPRLFEPFFTTRQDGLGLGLPLCESLAQAMGGSLIARNAAPHGAEFVLDLPLAQATLPTVAPTAT